MKRIYAIGLAVCLIAAMFTGCRARIEGETDTPTSSSTTNETQSSSDNNNQSKDNGVMDEIVGDNGRSTRNQPMQNMQ